MNEYLTNLFSTSSFTDTTSTGFLEILVILFWTFFLSLFIAFVYKKTYKWLYYNQNFVHTIIALAILIAFVMITVWSSVAWAFTLMWVLSIIRFKNSLKDTKDIWFIFFGIAIWLAMWTWLYTLAIVWTFVISFIFYLINRFSLFEAEPTYTQILKILVSEEVDFNNLFDDIFKKYTKYFELKWVNFIFETKVVDANWNAITETIFEAKLKTLNILNVNWNSVSETFVEKYNELTYKIIHNTDLNIREFLKEIEKISGNNKVSILNIWK